MSRHIRQLTNFAVYAGISFVLLASAVTGVGLLASRGSADSLYSPVWVLSPYWDGNSNNWTTYSSCSDWKDDNSYFPPGPPTTYAKISDYWSGRAVYWNYPSANGCWHNDEVSSVWWRAIDFFAASGTVVRYRHEIGGPSQWASTYFSTAGGCPGIKVDVYTPNGYLAGSAHYWHMTAYSGVAGTWSSTHIMTSPATRAYRNLGTVISPINDTCTNTGAHVHQAVLQGGWAQPNKDGAVTWGPMSFGW